MGPISVWFSAVVLRSPVLGMKVFGLVWTALQETIKALQQLPLPILQTQLLGCQPRLRFLLGEHFQLLPATARPQLLSQLETSLTPPPPTFWISAVGGLLKSTSSVSPLHFSSLQEGRALLGSELSECLLSQRRNPAGVTSHSNFFSPLTSSP